MLDLRGLGAVAITRSAITPSRGTARFTNIDGVIVWVQFAASGILQDSDDVLRGGLGADLYSLPAAGANEVINGGEDADLNADGQSDHT